METKFKDDASRALEQVNLMWPPSDFWYLDVAEFAQKAYRAAPWACFLWALWFAIRLWESDNETRFETRMHGFDILLRFRRPCCVDMHVRVNQTNTFISYGTENKIRFDFSEEARKLWTR